MKTQFDRPSRLWAGFAALAHFGPRWAAGRVRRAVRLRLGTMARRDPVRAWPQRSDDAGFLTAAPRVLPGVADPAWLDPLLAQWDAGADEPPQAEAEALLAGRFRFFGWREENLGAPPAWHRNAFTGETLPADRHWSRIPDFAAGDIKVVWEPSRWGWALALARAFARTGDRRFADRFRALADDWLAANPPAAGPNWKCGQESALRLIAAAFATAVLAVRGGVDAVWIRRIAALAEATVRRIEADLDYALSQDNNHGLSELAGLLTAAVLFPGLPGNRERLARAREGWHREVGRLVAADGVFSQYSVNYQRLLLHDAAWAGRLLQAAGTPLRAEALARIDAAADWLWQVTDPATGGAPDYGANDGANFLKLDSGRYGDYRAAVQTAFLLTRGAPALPPGPWDEPGAWLFGAEALRRPRQDAPRRALAAASAGFFVLRRAGTDVFVRCGPHRFRPHHADQLHIDLRVRGRPWAIDPGTYSYNAPAPRQHAFRSTRFHNTVTVDGLDQMTEAGRFLWFPWSRGVSTDPIQGGGGAVLVWEGETDCWRARGLDVMHRRAVVLHAAGEVTVIDRLQASARHEYRLHWLLPDGALTAAPDGRAARLERAAGGQCAVAVIATGGPGEAGWVRADPGSGRGWAAPRYFDAVPAWSWAVTVRGAAAWFATHFAPAPAAVHWQEHSIIIYDTQLDLGRTGAIVRAVTVRAAPGGRPGP